MSGTGGVPTGLGMSVIPVGRARLDRQSRRAERGLVDLGCVGGNAGRSLLGNAHEVGPTRQGRYR